MEKRKEEETSNPSNSINPEEIFCFCGPQSLSKAVMLRLVCASESPGKFKAQERA